MASSSSESLDLLCIILDLNLVSWTQSEKPSITGDYLSLEGALEQLLIFCNAHLALRQENQLAVFAAGLGMSRMLFSTALPEYIHRGREDGSVRGESNIHPQFRIADQRLVNGVKELLEEDIDLDSKREIVFYVILYINQLKWSAPAGKTGLVAALSIALCHINRLNISDTSANPANKPRPRILVLSVTEDASSQYVPMMNCIFSAQKTGIPIDVCKIYGPDAVFLQQACHLTNGTYYKVERRGALLQYLIMIFLPGPTARRHLMQPAQEEVDLRAACFCHRRIIDTGYVCSVCLSIFCSPVPVCATCRTKFPIATLKRFGSGASKARPAARAPASRGANPAIINGHS